MTATNKPMTGAQLDELMAVAMRMQYDSEKMGERSVSMFAYAVQVAVLEIRETRCKYAELQSQNADMAVQLANAESKCRELSTEVSELKECKNLLEKIKSMSCHVDTSPGAFIPSSLDAWGRPVPQYLPYDFSGNPGASATQYCNGWNDAGGYWLNHVKYLQECIRINNSHPEEAQ